MLWADRPSLTARRACLVLYWVAIYILTHWPDIDRLVPTPDWPCPEFDKFVHFCMYAGWAVMWWWLLSAGGRPLGKPIMIWILVGGAAYGIFDELTQAIVGRTPDILDFSCDFAGLLLASLLLRAWQKRRFAPGLAAVRARAG